MWFGAVIGAVILALGVGKQWKQITKAGLRPLLLAAPLFGGLVGGGFILTQLLVAYAPNGFFYSAGSQEWSGSKRVIGNNGLPGTGAMSFWYTTPS